MGREWDYRRYIQGGKNTPQRAVWSYTNLPRDLADRPDGKVLFTNEPDYTLKFRAADTGQQTGRALAHADWINAAAFSPDGRLVITGSNDGLVRAWRVSQ